MITDPVLTELWLFSLYGIINGTLESTGVHEDHVEAVRAWRSPGRPRA